MPIYLKNHPKIILFLLCFFGAQASFAQSKEAKNRLMDTVLYYQPEVLPIFPGGESKLMEFIAGNVQYPEKARKKGNVGTSYVSFVIDETGAVANIRLFKGMPGCEACDSEAIRVVKLMPNWTPGRQDDKAVPVQYVLPIKFSLK